MQSCKTKIDKGALRIGRPSSSTTKSPLEAPRVLQDTSAPAAVRDQSIDTLKAEDQASVSDWYSNPVAYERKRKADRLAQAVAAASGNATADAAPPSTPPAKKPAAQVQQADSREGGSGAGRGGEAAGVRGALRWPADRAAQRLPACQPAAPERQQGRPGRALRRSQALRQPAAPFPVRPRPSEGRLRVAARARRARSLPCPGGYDDDEHVRCSYRAQSAERPPWVDGPRGVHQAAAQVLGQVRSRRRIGGGGHASGQQLISLGGAGSTATPDADAKQYILVD